MILQAGQRRHFDMRVTDIAVSFRLDYCLFEATIRSDVRGEPLVLWYRIPADLGQLVNANSSDALAAALVLPAMRLGEAVDLPVPISPKLARALHRIQAIYQSWDPTLSVVEIKAPHAKNISGPGTEIGLFFSCGVDSFYSLVRNTIDHPLNEDVITHLIAVRGMDTEVRQKQNLIYETMLANTVDIARQLGKKAIGVTTNVKDVMSALGYPTGMLGHGAALASVGLLLQPTFKKLYVAASDSYEYLPPEASHPLLDPLWSTEVCSFVHDGCEASRLGKIETIAQFPYVLDKLRVCWQNRGLELNCGRCAKCLRTMIELKAVGALSRCPTLPHDVELAALVGRMPLLDFPGEFVHGPLPRLPDPCVYLQEILDKLEHTEGSAALRASLETALASQKAYFDRLDTFRRTINKLIPPSDNFILVEDDGIWKSLGAGRNVYRLVETQDQYYFNPKDDEMAVRELERLKDAGAKFIVFWGPEFWWFDYYNGFNRHLRSNYRLLVEDDTMVVFQLTGPPAAPVA
jgi:hypothetical protein